MRLDIINKITYNKYNLMYLHDHSYWYKYLNRNPDNFSAFENEVKNEYHLNRSDKLLGVIDKIEMGSLIFDMLKR